MTIASFEYQNKNDETPFETFLRYTDEKEKSAVQLAAILDQTLPQSGHVLDVGTGNGEYIELALSKMNVPSGLQLTLVEPSGDLLEGLEQQFPKQFPNITVHVVQSGLQAFTGNELFDVILMSHLFYHIPRATWTDELARALSLLKPGGSLIVVLREKDDAYDFKMAFKPLLFDASFQALTIDDVLDVLPEEAKSNITRHHADSELRIPYVENHEDTVAIIEFYLNKRWTEIPEQIRQDALQFIADRNGVFKQRDGIAVVTRPK